MARTTDAFRNINKETRSLAMLATTNRLPLFCTVAFTALFVCSCISPDNAMKSWLGHHGSEVIASWGPPLAKYPDGQGGEVWVYQSHRQWTTPGQVNSTAYGNANTYGSVSGTATYYPNSAGYNGTYQRTTTYSGNATTTYTPPQTYSYEATRSFFLDSNGIVYRYAWRGR